jgi:putative membrane protein
MKTQHSVLYAILGALAIGHFACANDEPAKTPSNADPSTNASGSSAPTSGANAPTHGATPLAATDNAAPVQPESSAVLTNEQILEVTRTAHEGEIQQARLAQSRSKSPRVQSLASMMLRDHKDAEKKGDALAAKDNLVPQPSETSDSLRTDADGFTQALKAEDGAGFDKQYVDTQVREHEAVLDTIDRKLMPSASNPEVKAYLEDLRVSVSSHLEHARKLQQEMNKQAKN